MNEIVSQADVRKIVEARVVAAVAEALGTTGRDAVEVVVMDALNQRGPYGNQTRLQWLLNDEVGNLARQVIAAYLEEHREDIEQAVRKAVDAEVPQIAELVTQRLVAALSKTAAS